MDSTSVGHTAPAAQQDYRYCPVCNARATDTTTHTNPQGVVTVYRVCAHEHLWEIRWVASSWPAAS